MRSKRFGDITAIGAKTSNRCHICGDDLELTDYGLHTLLGPAAPTVDHVLAQGLGGDDDEENLLLACAGCNSFKGLRPAWEARLARRGVPWAPTSGVERVLLAATFGAIGNKIGSGVGATRDEDGRIQPNKDGAVIGTIAGIVLALALT